MEVVVTGVGTGDGLKGPDLGSNRDMAALALAGVVLGSGVVVRDVDGVAEGVHVCDVECR